MTTAVDYNKQTTAFHGVEKAKYAVRGDDGKVGADIKDLTYIKSVSFEPTVEQQAVYANNEKVLALVADQGYTGSIGTSSQDRALELAIGQIMELDGMQADVKINGFKRIDFYYEYKETLATGTEYMVKVWALNIEISKAAKAHSTDTNTATIGEYSYAITVYGDKIKTADGLVNYTDALGNEKTAVRLVAVPSDAGYDAFGTTVPTPKMKAEIADSASVMSAKVQKVKE